jgi:hypothetical protein
MPATIRLTEAAALLRVPYQKAHRLVLTGDLRGELRDGRWLVDAADAARLANERAQPARDIDSVRGTV